MLLPLSLLFVGAVLTLNGLWMMNRIADKDAVVINLAAAFITGTVAILSMAKADAPDAVKAAALTLLFSVTYLWVGTNRLTGSDGRGLGWFSLFVAICAFHGRWAPIPRDRGHLFHGIVGSHSRPRAGWPTASWSQA